MERQQLRHSLELPKNQLISGLNEIVRPGKRHSTHKTFPCIYPL